MNIFLFTISKKNCLKRNLLKMKLSLFQNISIKMLVFIFNAIGLLGISQAFYFEEPSVCTSNNNALICKCNGRENFTLTASANLDIKWITVEGCGVVHIPLGAIPHLQLQEFTLTDIDSLIIGPFSFFGAQTLRTLKIENVREIDVLTHGFLGLFNLENFIMKNVTSKQLPEASFGGISIVEKFNIEDSYFEKVEDNAFMVSNISNLSIVNCTFGILESSAFVIHAADEVIFKNCNMKETRNSSLLLSNVNSLSIIQSDIELLASNSINTRNLQTFKFEHCIVSELETNAFALVDASEIITFQNNVIELADEYSLFLRTKNSTTENTIIYSCCNAFTCDCNLYWMWKSSEDPLYEDLLKTSFCIGKETNLSSLVPILDSFENCMTLEKKIYQTNYTSSEKIQMSSQAITLKTEFILLSILFGYTVYNFCYFALSI